MRRLPPHLAAAGYSPARYVPLSPAPELDQGQRLTDIRAIQRLFSNGENGGYWPADPAYLYEDSAGTIPATLNGVCGLRYDNSRGMALGQNEVTNGDCALSPTAFGNSVSFYNSTGSANSTYNIKLVSAAEGGNARFIVNSMAVGKQYIVSVDLYIPSSFTNCTIGDVINSVQMIIKTFTERDSVISFRYVSARIFTASDRLMMFGYLGTNTTDTLSIDNIVIKEVLGNHAIQATTANKPYLRRTPVSNKYWLDSNTSTGALTATFASALGSACTIATVGAEGVTIAENQTVSTTYNLTPPYGYNGDVLIINRALTAVEKALVTRVLRRNVPTLGSELVTNGGFDTDSGWTFGVNCLVSGGAASASSELNNVYVAFRPSELPIGKRLLVRFKIIALTSGAFSVYLGGSLAGSSTAIGTVFKTGVTANATFGIFCTGASTTGTIDDISCKEIL